MYEVVSSDLFHSNLTASTCKHSESLSGFERVAALGATGPGSFPPPLPDLFDSSPPLPPQEISKIEKKRIISASKYCDNHFYCNQFKSYF